MVGRGGGDKWSYNMSSQIITTNKPAHGFLQAGCSSCRPANSVKALKGRSIALPMVAALAVQSLGVEPTISLSQVHHPKLLHY